MKNQTTSIARTNARLHRRDMTDSERKLWTGLRGEQLGYKFRRQHPLGNYIADFACLAPKLIVEPDGSQHQQQVEYDAKRYAFFHAQGFGVSRFASNEPFINLEGVLQAVLNRLDEMTAVGPHPCLPPGGEGVIPEKSFT
ncbi:endonuclease domain-containing protein [Variovorax sp. RHLX14]|uniref:endonuclease domain-containing protein n=1 Tax=Variovorax sp. RHLX14 TaxID=1259731 RepID=UPI003F46D272